MCTSNFIHNIIRVLFLKCKVGTAPAIHMASQRGYAPVAEPDAQIQEIDMFAPSLNESLKRSLIGGLGATMFGLTCLLAAAAPATAYAQAAPATLAQPANTPQS